MLVKNWMYVWVLWMIQSFCMRIVFNFLTILNITVAWKTSVLSGNSIYLCCQIAPPKMLVYFWVKFYIFFYYLNFTVALLFQLDYCLPLDNYQMFSLLTFAVCYFLSIHVAFTQYSDVFSLPAPCSFHRFLLRTTFFPDYNIYTFKLQYSRWELVSAVPTSIQLRSTVFM